MADTEPTDGHPLGWSCGDGIVVTGEYCFRELRLEGIDVVAVALGDLTGDGRAEVVMQTRDELRSYEVHDDGRVLLLDAWADGLNANGISLLIGDFDGDGRRDLVRKYQFDVSLFPQRADGSMQDSPVIASSQEVGPAYGVVDINRDGGDELLTLGQEVPGRTPPRVTGIEYRDGKWDRLSLGFEFWQPWEWAFGDVDGDGVIDPAVIMAPFDAAEPEPYIPDEFDTRSAYLGWARPETAEIVLGSKLTPGFYASKLGLGDLDGDGYLDVVLATSDEQYDYDEPSPLRVVYWGRGNWEFDGPDDIGYIGTDSFSVIDLDGDGIAELVGAQRPHEVWTFSGERFDSITVDALLCTGSKNAADINADGVMDCVKGRDGLSIILSDP